MATVQYQLDDDFKPYDVTAWFRSTEPGHQQTVSR